MKAIILAGGRGTRLRPYTSVLPKPLMPIGDRSILEIVIDQLAEHGFREIFLCVGHLAHLIESVLDQTRRPDVDIVYVREDLPLGTAGPLRSIADLASSTSPFLVMNGDVLTSLDYGALFAHHLKSGHAMTIAMNERQSNLDYGILQLEPSSEEHSRVLGFLEKPSISVDVSMGIYVLEPRAVDVIPVSTRFDVPDLIHALLEGEEAVGAYHHSGFWLDIGRPEDYAAAGELWAAANGLPAVDAAGAEADPSTANAWSQASLRITAFEVLGIGKTADGIDA